MRFHDRRLAWKVTLSVVCLTIGAGCSKTPPTAAPSEAEWPAAKVMADSTVASTTAGSVAPAAKPAEAPTPLLAKIELVFQAGHFAEVTSVALSDDGSRILTGSRDNMAILWDAKSREKLRTFTGHVGSVFSVALSGGGSQVLTGSTDKTAILWDAKSGEKLRTFTGHTSSVLSVALSSDGSRVLTGSADKTAILWDAKSGEKLRTFTGHSNAVYGVSLSRDGSSVLTGSWDQTAILWDAKSGEKIRTFSGHTNVVNSVTLSSDGNRVLTGSWDKTAILWDAKSGEKLNSFTGHVDRLSSVALSGDGNRVFTGSADKTAILWDAKNGAKLITFIGHTNSVEGLALSADCSQVLTGSGDGTTKVWDTKTGKELCTLISIDAGQDWLVVTPEGLFDGSPEGVKVVSYRISGTNDLVVPLVRRFDDFNSPGLFGKIMRVNRGALATAAEAGSQAPKKAVAGVVDPAPEVRQAPKETFLRVDPAVLDVFGLQSRKYTLGGFKGVTLWTHYDDLEKTHPLIGTRDSAPWVFLTSEKADEELIFDASKRLVCYTKSYEGGPADYLEDLIELFGKTQKPIREYTSRVLNTGTHKTFVSYTFPKVLARVVFVKSVTVSEFGGSTQSMERTYVSVIDRQFVSDTLSPNAVGKRKLISWLKSVGDQVKDRAVDVSHLPKLEGVAMKEQPEKLEVVQFVDLRREEENRKKKTEIQVPAAAAAIELDRGIGVGPATVRVHFVFGRYTPLAGAKVLGQVEAEAAGKNKNVGNNALDYTPFDELKMDLNSVLMQESFPPKTDKISYVTTKDGTVYYEWRSRNGWLVRCGNNDAVTIEWVGGKGL